jgi:hypothetical protein
MPIERLSAFDDWCARMRANQAEIKKLRSLEDQDVALARFFAELHDELQNLFAEAADFDVEKNKNKRKR